jgi:hypothetical protein
LGIIKTIQRNSSTDPHGEGDHTYNQENFNSSGLPRENLCRKVAPLSADLALFKSESTFDQPKIERIESEHVELEEEVEKLEPIIDVSDNSMSL